MATPTATIQCPRQFRFVFNCGHGLRSFSPPGAFNAVQSARGTQRSMEANEVHKKLLTDLLDIYQPQVVV
jgi:hypothetical protein